jgi:GLPGLI family protein
VTLKENKYRERNKSTTIIKKGLKRLRVKYLFDKNISMKTLKYLILFFALILAQREVHAQNTVFLSQGRIEYERKVNLWAQLDDIDDDAWREFEKKRTPQFKTTYFDLEFYGNKTLFKPGRENTDNNKLWQEPAEDNTVFTDLDKEQRISQKNVFEETFLVEDSMEDNG